MKDYRVPDSDLIIVKGTSVLISTYGVHNDPSIFPNPERFAPERFRDNNNQKSSLIVFGAGQKRCPGNLIFILILTEISVLFIFLISRKEIRFIDNKDGHCKNCPKILYYD